jgi:multiple sugar transport system ATP-binding protein
MSEIRIENVAKSFGAFTLFRDLSLQVEASRYVCLVGPSGCGKTTLMRIIAGLDSPRSGRVFIGGRLVTGEPPHARDIGLAFQNYALYPHLSERDNLAFPLRAPIRRGQLSQAEIAERVVAVAARLKIEHLLDRSVNHLSGGQMQRVALSRALVRRPRVLLLDEPLTHLDAQLRYAMRAELKLLHADLQMTTIHVTHDQQEALAVADVIVVMRDGRIEQVGAPLALYDDPGTAFVAGFLGDPPMSLLDARLAESAGVRGLDVARASIELPPALADAAGAAAHPEVQVGLRPRQIELASPGEAGVLAATVHVHEMIGREHQIILRVGDSLLRYRTRVPRRVHVGEAMAVRLHLDGARLFDRRTGRALRGGAAPARRAASD